MCKVAAYEPPFAVAGFDSAHWAPRFDRELAAGRLAAAMLTVIEGTGDSRILKCLPRALLVPLLQLAVRADAKRVQPGDVSIAQLIPTMHYDAQIVREASAWFTELSALQSDVLLIGGSASADFLTRALDELAKLLPHTERVQLQGVAHVAADNEGRPELVGAALRRFFGA
jgi:hypothetical protein